MSYYLCAWHAKDSRDHTVIKCGQLAVATWLRMWLFSVGTGCPEEIVKQLETLDEDSDFSEEPTVINWTGNNHTYSITEIMDLGVFSSDMWVAIDKDSFELVVLYVRGARDWLKRRRGPTISWAEQTLTRVLALLAVPVDG